MRKEVEQVCGAGRVEGWESERGGWTGRWEECGSQHDAGKWPLLCTAPQDLPYLQNEAESGRNILQPMWRVIVHVPTTSIGSRGAKHALAKKKKAFVHDDKNPTLLRNTKAIPRAPGARGAT